MAMTRADVADLEAAIDAKVAAASKPRSSRQQARVTRVDPDGTVWVHVFGGAEETPLRSHTASVEPGDVIDVTFTGLSLRGGGNASDPAATTGQVRTAQLSAAAAKTAAEAAVADAGTARAAAEGAQRDAASARGSAASALSAASDAQASAGAAADAAAAADGKAVAAGEAASAAQASAGAAGAAAARADANASAAQAQAGRALASATSASESAAGALSSLSEVERVVGTLNWIAEHGRYVPSGDSRADGSKVYYERTGSGTEADPYAYSVVADPRDADVAGYYVLVVDESVQNYIASHLAQTDYGLDIMVDGTDFRLHLGTVDGGQAMGLHVIDGSGGHVASLGSEVLLGLASGAHVELGPDSLGLFGAHGSRYLCARTLHSGPGSVVDEFQAFYGVTTYPLSSVPSGDVSAMVLMRGLEDGEEAECSYDGRSNTVTVTVPIPDGKAQGDEYPGRFVRVRYETGDALSGAVSIGVEDAGSTPGASSLSVGLRSAATGDYGFASGRESQAAGECSAAIGTGAVASGANSAAIGSNVVARGANQLVVGDTNVPDGDGKYALIVGNGRTYLPFVSESNALTVDWDGNVEAAGEVAATDAGGSAHKLTEKADASDVEKALAQKADASAAVTAIVRSGNTFTPVKASGANGATFSQQDCGPVYGTCLTPASTEVKAVRLSRAINAKIPGALLFVKFTYACANTATTRLQVLIDGQYNYDYAYAPDGTSVTGSSAHAWAAGDTVAFMWDGSYWRLVCNVSRLGRPLPVAQGGTGATSAAAARANLGVNAANVVDGNAISPASVTASGTVKAATVEDSGGTLAALRESVSRAPAGSADSDVAALCTGPVGAVRGEVVFVPSAKVAYFRIRSAGGDVLSEWELHG